VLWQTTRANITALTERVPESVALAKYAQAGRILADQTESIRDGAARVALVDTLHDMVERLEVPSLSTFEMRHEQIPAVVADSPGSSMRTNPVALTEAELMAVLEAAL
jgi:alcohol dehydrogenase class IV